MDKTERQIEELRKGLEDLKATLETQYSNKAFLSDALADLKGHIIERERKIDKKIDILREALKREEILTEKEQKELKKLQVFSPVYLKDKESWGL